jgi:hypothetical protein
MTTETLEVMPADAPAVVTTPVPIVPCGDVATSRERSDSVALSTLESLLMTLPEATMPLVHRFTPWLYAREITMPAGTMLTSRIHNTEHPFVISKGDISVWTKQTGIVRLKAPYTGITVPGTRRLLYAHEDTVWTTFHVTDKVNPEEIVKAVTLEHPAFIEPSAEEKMAFSVFLSACKAVGCIDGDKVLDVALQIGQTSDVNEVPTVNDEVTS